jgi:NAD(P)-dependent dehydrogenase (short-subunit alcohol dehydrogenase family)
VCCDAGAALAQTGLVAAGPPPKSRPPKLAVVSKSPLRRLSESLLLASMRPALTEQALRRRGKPVDLKGKRVLLTGASSGIGEAAAQKFARRGAQLVVVARRQELLDDLVERITRDGGDARAHAADLSDLDAVDEVVAKVEQDLGGIDILINNAARSIRRPLAESLDRWHDVERTMTLNYYSPLRLIRGIAPAMLARGDGHIINVSTWGVLSESSPLFSVYNASKAALSAVSRVIETEWSDKGVHSTTLYYPLVLTPMIAPTRAYDGLPGLSAEEAADWMVTAARTRPVRIAPRMAITAHAVNSVAPAAVDAIMRRQRVQPKD